MNWFFFGTLMDPQVLEIAAGRTVLEEETIIAELHGYKRVTVANEQHSTLAHIPYQTVEGILVESLDATESLRILHFEGDKHTPEEVQLQLKNQKPVSAYCFLPTAKTQALTEDWDFEQWRRKHLQSFLLLSEKRMDSYR